MGMKPEETEAQKYVYVKARQSSAAAQAYHHLLCGPKGTQSALWNEEYRQPPSLSPPHQRGPCLPGSAGTIAMTIVQDY